MYHPLKLQRKKKIKEKRKDETPQNIFAKFFTSAACWNDKSRTYTDWLR